MESKFAPLRRDAYVRMEQTIREAYRRLIDEAQRMIEWVVNVVR